MNPHPERTTRGVASPAALEKCAVAFEAELAFIYRALRRNGINESDAQDLAHEIFLVMWRRWGDYDAQRPLRPWLAGIAYRIAYNHRARIGREVPAGLVDREDEADDPESRVAATRDRDLVRCALESIPEKQRAVLVLHDLEGVPMREIAGLMAIPLFTAYSRLRVGRKAFAAAVRRSHAVAAMAGLSALRPEALLAGARHEAPAEVPADLRRRVLSRMRAALLVPGLAGAERAAPLPEPGLPPRTGLGHLVTLALPAGLLGAVLLLGLGLGLRRRVAAPERLPASSAGALPEATEGRARQTGVARVAAGAAAMPTAVLLRPPLPRDPAAAGLGGGLVGYWRFDDGVASPLARDLSGGGNDCAMRRMEPAAAWTEGQLGGALNLAGGWLECGRVDALPRANSELTIALWVRRGTKNERVHALVTRQLERDTRDVFHFGFRDDLLLLQSSVWHVTLAAPFPRAPGRWFHVAGSLGRDGRARLYIDGKEVAHKTTGVPSGERAGTPLIIGAGINAADQVSATEVFEGAVDELLMYDRALAADEIAAIAAGTQPSLSP